MAYGISGDPNELVTIRSGGEFVVVRAALLSSVVVIDDRLRVEYGDAWYEFDGAENPSINGQEINPLAKAVEDRPACCEAREATSVTINASNLPDAEKIADAIISKARSANIAGYL